VEEVPTFEEHGAGSTPIQGVAPPARIEYLLMIDSMTKRVYWAPHPVPGLNFSPALYPGTKTQFSVGVGPGTKRIRCAATRFIQAGDNASATLDHAKFWNTDSGSGAHEAIRVENTAAGKTEAWPPAGADEIQKSQPGVVQWGSFNAAATVSAGSFPAGQDRMAEITESATSQVERFYDVQLCFGWGGLMIPSDDVTSL